MLYWMIAARRTRCNFALDRAIELAQRAGSSSVPLIVLEEWRAESSWDGQRHRAFVAAGMADNAARFAAAGVTYVPFIQRRRGQGERVLCELARSARCVVTDEFPGRKERAMVSSAAGRLDVRLEQVDANGLLPLRAAERVFPTAYAFRRFLQQSLPAHLGQGPRVDPLARLSLPPARLTAEVRRRIERDNALADGSASTFAGGSAAGAATLKHFLADRLDRYAAGRNHPDDEATSDLSPYLHFGHVGAYEVFARLMKREGWSIERLGRKATGRRAGWWGVGENAEAFLDQLVTWRELGFNMSHHVADCDRYETLPAWSRAALEQHAADGREHVYTVEQFAAAETHDAVWNAAQRQLVGDGRLHNYLRMLWGKKILEWTGGPAEALAVMTELNNRYALDGQDPNSVSGIAWGLGRYDRPWGPRRPIFGTVRYMSTSAALRKLRMKRYLTRYGG